jgi:uncharacterized protein (TIGR02246 family)
MKHFFAIPFFALLILAGCSSEPAKPVDTRTKDIESIRAAEVQANADWASRDLERIARFWADDATLLMPGQPVIKGKAAIKEMLQKTLADPKFAITFSPNTVEVSKSGDIGYTEGTASITMTDPKTKKVVTESDKYVTVYRKQADGNWLAVEDINNADSAPVAAAAVAEKPSAVAPAKAGKAKAKRAVRKKTAAKRKKRK